MDCRRGPGAMYLLAQGAVDSDEGILQKMDGLAGLKPKIMLVLGSGCGDVAKNIDIKGTLPYSAIPHMPLSTVEGHEGNFIFGRYAGKEVIAFQGRQHFYEGYSPQEASFMVHVAKHLGVEAAIMTAAGGVAPHAENVGSAGLERRYPARPGDLLLVRTVYPNFLPSSLRGPLVEGAGARFNGTMNMLSLYLNTIASSVAKREGIHLGECAYVPRQGPNYETPLEVSLLSRLAQVARMPVIGGMSTVPELEAANALGIDSLALVVVTNQMFDMRDRKGIEVCATGQFDLDEMGGSTVTLSEARAAVQHLIKAYQPSHGEVTEQAGRVEVTEKLERLIGGVVRAVRF